MPHPTLDHCFDFGMEQGDQSRVEPAIWGEIWEFGSPSYWRHRYAELGEASRNSRLGSDLREEIVACMLGGFGIPAEVALSAFDRIMKAEALKEPCPKAELLYELLSVPLTWVRWDGATESGRYRFARQRSIRIAQALHVYESRTPPKDEVVLRDWLLDLPGIGMKTASWIVRNHLNSDRVAIVDIHLRRAGNLARFFPITWTLPKDYRRFEHAFLAFSRSIDARPSILDSLIWSDMRVSGIRSIRNDPPRKSLVALVEKGRAVPGIV